MGMMLVSVGYGILLHSERLQDITKRPPIWMILLGLALAAMLIIFRLYDGQNKRAYLAAMIILFIVAVWRVFRLKSN